MAKEVGNFEIIIRGTKADGPQEVYVNYRLQDSADSEMKSGHKGKKLEDPSLNKTMYNDGSTGELWADELAQVETDEGL